MKKEFVISFLVVLVLLAGCGKKVEINIVPEEPEAEELPACNEDNICDATEDCDCIDCQETFECRRLAVGKDEYLLKKGMSEKIAGRTLTFVNLDSSGKTTVSVDGEKRSIEKTKFREIVNMLEVTVLETEYSIDPDNVISKFLLKEYQPGPDEYIFDRVGAEKIIESVRIRLNDVESSTPKNYVMLTVGDALNEKVREEEPKEIEGLLITLLEAHPRGTPVEDYAILKVEKA